MLFSLLSASCTPIQFSKTNVAMRDERAHAEFFSEGESLAIVVFRLPDIKGIFARRDLAKEPKSVRFVSSLFVLAGETQGALCGGTGIRFPPGQQIRFAQPDGPQRLALRLGSMTGRSTASSRRGIASALRPESA